MDHCPPDRPSSRSSASSSSEPQSQSRSTAMLGSLLELWRRQDIAGCLFHGNRPTLFAADDAEAWEQADAEQRLLSGQVRTSLEQQGRRKVSLPFGTEPAVGWFDAAYPELLRHVPDPPLLLYYQGDLTALDSHPVAVVGARRCSPTGRLFAEELGTALSASGVAVVSGLALGIDGAAHRGALASGGPVIAVLGSGLGRMYPARHARLAARIVRQGGLLLSEYPHTQRPNAWQFPERNRIVSGLSMATVVVEAGERSGSLITARLALEQGRDVFAVPGPVGSHLSSGCHRLIQQGAGLITGAIDVLAELGYPQAELDGATGRQGLTTAPESANVSAMGHKLLALFMGRLRSMDELIVHSGIPEQTVSRELALLELQGFVQRETDGYIATSKILKQEK